MQRSSRQALRDSFRRLRDRWGWRQTIIAGLAILLVAALALTSLGSRTAKATATPPTKQEIAQKLLESRAGQTMSASARLYFEMLARGDHRVAPDSTGLDFSKAKQHTGGHHPGGPGALANIRVNNPGEDTNQPDQTTQSETSVAVSGKNVVVGYNDSQTTLLFLTPGSDLSGVAVSHTGGNTFTDMGALPNATPTIGFGDPWLAADSAGNFYYSELADNPFQGLLVGVAKSTDGGQTFSTPVLIAPPPPGPNELFFAGDDKDALTASSTALVDTWDDVTVNFDPNTGNFTVLSGLTVAHSTDGGKTWSAVYADQIPIFTSSDFCSFHQYIGAQPIVGPDGTVYVAALRVDVNDPTCSGAPETESESIFASHDGGATFGPGVKIADVTPSTGVPFGAFVLGPGQFMRNAEFPTLAFLGSTLYATWNDGGDGSGHSHIRLAKSTDGGATWSTSFVTSGSNDEAQPSLSADASGLHILYYEISPAGDGTSVLDAFVSDSSDGSSFTATRVSNQSFPGVFTVPQFDPIIAFAYMGDYISGVSSGGHQYFAWGDNRDIVTNFLWPQGRHDPDVFFAVR